MLQYYKLTVKSALFSIQISTITLAPIITLSMNIFLLRINLCCSPSLENANSSHYRSYNLITIKMNTNS
jgi:hypothetical protein